MRPARIFRWAVRIVVLFLTATMSIISLLGGLSAVNVFSNPNNINIPSGTITDYNITSSEPYVAVPFNLTNAGYFDLTNFKVDFSINNGTVGGTVYDGSKNYGTIVHGTTLSDHYNATNLNFDVLKYSPVIYANITVSAYYSLELISFTVQVINLNITDLLGGG